MKKGSPPPDAATARTVRFIQSNFSEYYKHAELFMPPRFGKREWGFFTYGGRGMMRPVVFRTRKEARNFLASRTPAHAYFSTAYYERPEVPMAEKVWLGADLVFDLDADHIKGAEEMTYPQMLAAVKMEFIKLIDDYLVTDFGFDVDGIEIVFSGGRGYHIHIRDPKVLGLSASERRGVVDYITGTDIEWDSVFKRKALFANVYKVRKNIQYYYISSPDDLGWGGKMMRGTLSLVDRWEDMLREDVIAEIMTEKGIGNKGADVLYDDLFKDYSGNRGVDRLRNEGQLNVFSTEDDLQKFLGIVKDRVKTQMEGETDEPVTADVKRLIRLPTSIHGKSSLRVCPLNREMLDDFDPLVDAVIFGDELVEVDVVKPTEVTLKDFKGKIEAGRMELPLYQAMFMMCGRMALLAE